MTVGVFCLPLIREHWGLSGTVVLLAGASLLGLLVTWLARLETRVKALDTVAGVVFNSRAISIIVVL